MAGDWVPIVSVVTTGAVSLLLTRITIRHQAALARETRLHDLRMARESLSQERRGQAYVDLMVHISRTMAALSSVAGAAIPAPSSEEVMLLLARVGAFGTPEVNEIFVEWLHLASESPSRPQQDFLACTNRLRQRIAGELQLTVAS